MKTLTTIKKEIEELLALDRHKEKPSVLSRAKKRIQFLRMCQHYLETQPSTEFLQKEKARLENRLDLIEDNFDYYKATATAKKPLKEYAKLMDTKSVKEQLKTIKYLIN